MFLHGARDGTVPGSSLVYRFIKSLLRETISSVADASTTRAAKLLDGTEEPISTSIIRESFQVIQN